MSCGQWNWIANGHLPQAPGHAGDARITADMDQPDAMIRVIETLWTGVHLLVVGDVMLDRYIWGEVERISPEAPIPVVKALRDSHQAGGAANVAMNAAAMGAQVTVIGVIGVGVAGVGLTGSDADGELLAAQLASADVRSELVMALDRPTTSKTRILGGRQQMLRLDVECSAPVSSVVEDELLERALACLDRPESGLPADRAAVSAIVLSDYAKGVLTDRVCRRLIDRATELGIPVIVDPKGRDWTRYRGATLLCPNLAELCGAAGSAGPTSAQCLNSDMDAALDGGEATLAQLGVELLVVTLSERGIVLLDGKTRRHAPARARQVFDVSGAGDTVTAVVALGRASGMEGMTTVRLANLAAGIVVGKVGTAPVYRHELIAALSGDVNAGSAGKIFELEQMSARVDAWRAAGDRIIFTNGCFDLLHAGHITLLEEARRHGDRLIVGLNSDASVRALKGPSRPLTGEAQRARLLAALAAVDGVVLFTEETPLSAILALQPDVLVKGGDYEERSIVGAAEVRAWGGNVIIVPINGDWSTTQMIAKAYSSCI